MEVNGSLTGIKNRLWPLTRNAKNINRKCISVVAGPVTKVVQGVRFS